MSKNKPTTMAGSWEMYDRMVFGANRPGRIQLTETRRAFYAGMMSLQAIINELPEDENEAMARLSSLQTEAITYTAELVADIMTRRAAGEK